MKVKDLFKNVKKPKLPDWYRFAMEDLFEEFNLNLMDYDYHELAKSERLAGYWLSYWKCTDTQVGTRLYFFDGKPCACTHQPYRKSDANWAWVSKEMFLEVRAFVESFRNKEEYSPTLLDLDADMPEIYKLDYREQLYSDRKTAYLNGRPVTILGIGDRDFYKEVPEDLITIRHADGEDETVEMTQLNFRLELNDEDMEEK